MKRRHVKEFQVDQYKKADRRIKDTLFMCWLEFQYGEQCCYRRLNRYQII